MTSEDLFALRAENWELQARVGELSALLDDMRIEREEAMDNATSLHRELEAMRSELKIARATVDRLRLHIQQGVEL
jgi:predicted  nucleic acid-binding Zn-ribbon protein